MEAIGIVLESPHGFVLLWFDSSRLFRHEGTPTSGWAQVVGEEH